MSGEESQKSALIHSGKGQGQGRKMYGSTSGSGGGGNQGSDFNVGFQGPSTSGVFDVTHFHRLCDNITSNVFAITKHGKW